MTHSKLTIVAVYGHNDGASAIPALTESMFQLPGSKGLLLSVGKPANLPADIEWKQILPMNYRQYSLFMMFSLQHHIETDYCLTVQDDGWVLNGKNWDDRFFDYDYVGAPCHAAIVDNRLVTGYQWVNLANPIVIQNGGFSLRSQKYLKAASASGALYHFSDEAVLQNEDVQLTGIWRDQLEKQGIKFAPESLAKQFSIEFLGPKFHDDLNFDGLFGIHGRVRKLIQPRVVNYLLTEHEATKIYREYHVIQFLRSIGYSLRFSV